MTHLTLSDVTSILANSYYEVLATTELGKTTVDGKPVVTEPDDVFLVKLALITTKELRNLLEYRLVDVKTAAVRLRALSLAADTDTTDKQIYDALVEYDCHPELVSVVTAMGKSFVIGTVKLVKKRRTYNRALAQAASGGRIKAMKLLKQFGAYDYNWALADAALGGQLEAMNLLKDWGATDFDAALRLAAVRGRLDAMRLLKDWGATDFDWALWTIAGKGQLEAMKLLKEWGATDYDYALGNASGAGCVEDMRLLKKWGAMNFDWALGIAAAGGHLKAMRLLKKWGAVASEDICKLATLYGHLEASSLVKEWLKTTPVG
jgi:hypothetical protein